MTETDRPPITLRVSKDFGRATVATKSLGVGYTILREKPLFTVVLLDGIGTAEVSRLVVERYRNMPITDRALFDQLHMSEFQTTTKLEKLHPARDRPELLATLSRFDTNCFLLFYEGKNAHRDGVFYRSSFFNHSCTPNANWSWCHVNNELVVKSTKVIDAGEEITISYIDCLFHSREDRQEACSRLGFVCQCCVCIQATDPFLRRKLAKWVQHYEDNVHLQQPAMLKCFDMIEYYALKSDLHNDELAWW